MLYSYEDDILIREVEDRGYTVIQTDEANKVVSKLEKLQSMCNSKLNLLNKR